MGIIDSQDAIIGNLLYDVASLVDDVRIKTSNNFKRLLIKHYLLNTKKINKKSTQMPYKT